jgi:hypothetical protein
MYFPMLRSFFTLAVIGFLLGLSGCASPQSSNDDSVSTIPWNRPAQWEGQGPMGGMMMMQQGAR